MAKTFSAYLDEIQKIPSLLDEIHRLIERRIGPFLLTGSSARKLRHGDANLLGGRAWQAHLFPLTSTEIPDFNLVQYLNRGGLPHIYGSDQSGEELQNYVSLYLKEEVKEEALTRRMGDFARFFDVMGIQNGEELNFENISSDCGVKAKTVQNYIEILEDTLIGFQVPAFRKTKSRKAITRSKFFLFDVGVVNALAERGDIRSKSELFGKAFEHFMTLELRAYLSYRNLRGPLQYWRSTSGFEVDTIVGNHLALEFKSTDCVVEKQLRGLRALRDEGLIRHFAVVSLDPELRRIDEITVYPYMKFLKQLWGNQIL